MKNIDIRRENLDFSRGLADYFCPDPKEGFNVWFVGIFGQAVQSQEHRIRGMVDLLRHRGPTVLG